jgi:hypothetical protein
MWAVVCVVLSGVNVCIFGKLELEKVVLDDRDIGIQVVEARHVGLTLCIQCLYCGSQVMVFGQ